MTTEATTIHPEGALLRVTDTHKCGGEQSTLKGVEFEVEFYATAEEAEGEAYYNGQTQHGYNVDALPQYVELVKTPEQMRARRIPTAEQIIAELDCMDDYDDFEINAADAPDGASREISGVTADGLFFACTITVSDVYQGDF